MRHPKPRRVPLRSIAVGTRVNVRPDPTHPPLWRTLAKVEERREDGHVWLFWHWKPEPNPTGIDCGYSACRDDHEWYATLALEVAAKP